MSREHDDLEEIVSSEKKSSSNFKKYAVDTTSSWLYWTPIMSVTEHFSGMEAKEILTSRLLGIGLGLFVARPYGRFREYWADQWDADATSSQRKKLLVDTSAHLCFQIPCYSTMLYFSGASLEEGLTALATGVAVGTVLGRPFGYVQDKWRGLWGTRPTLDT